MRLIFDRDSVPFNSSSDHTIIKFKNIEDTTNLVDVGEHNTYYGWNDFRLKTKEAKISYVIAQLLYNTIGDLVLTPAENNKPKLLYKDFRDWYYSRGFNELLKEIPEDLKECTDIASIDHQSVWLFPRDFKDDYSDFKYFKKSESEAVSFIKDVIKSLLEDDIVIYGGNDNDDNGLMKTEIEGAYEVAYLLLKKQWNEYYARKDGNVWVIYFSKTKGISIVDTKEKTEDPTDIPYLNIPYLVDVQVSDKCSRNCSFCYRCCSADKGEISSKEMHDIVKLLAEIGVFNIVLGGGNLAEHKEYPDMGGLEDCAIRFSNYRERSCNYSLSTTIHMNDFVKGIDDGSILNFAFKFDGLGISVPPTYDALELSKMLSFIANLHEALYVRHSNGNAPKFVLQIIPELFSVPQLQQLFSIVDRQIDVDINFLGYKDGAANKSYSLTDEQKGLIASFCNNRYHLMCDAFFVEKYKNFLESTVKPENRALLKQEGYGSCFFDAINKRLYMSSTSDVYVDFDLLKEYDSVSYKPMKEIREHLKTYFTEKRKELHKAYFGEEKK